MFLLAYIYWVALSRLLQTLSLLASRPTVSWTYPFLLYYNQIYGSAIKTYMLFHQDRQKWTRQKTVLKNTKKDSERTWISVGSRFGHYASIFLLVTAIGLYFHAIEFRSIFLVMDF
jgi:glycosyltransferase Alg8